MSERGMSYKDSGVDIDKEEKTISALTSQFKGKGGTGFGMPLDLPGHYTGLVDFGEYALSMCTDGVGTKLLIAEAVNKWDTVGIDCMAMNVNDVICVGAKPIAFVDYLAVATHEPEVAAEIGKGLAEGARQADLSIIGGETATIPDLVRNIDLAGTCMGYVKKKDIITGSSIQPGDILIGLASTGIHSNGYSLVRKILERNGISYTDTFPDSEATWAEVLLTPTGIYVKELLEAVDKFKLKGLAHITGGGLRNIPRLKREVKYNITDPLPPQPVFAALQKLGGVSDREMYKTFNMGMGFCVVASPEDAPGVIDALSVWNAKRVGEVSEGSGVAHVPLGLVYSKD